MRLVRKFIAFALSLAVVTLTGRLAWGDVPTVKAKFDITLPGSVEQMAFGKDAQIAIVCIQQQKAISIFDTKTGKELPGFTPPNASADHFGAAVSLSPDQKWLAVVRDGQVYMLDGATAKLSRTLSPRAAMVFPKISWSADSKRFLTVANTEITSWDASTFRETMSIKKDANFVAFDDACFSPDGKHIAANDGPADHTVNGAIGIFDAATGKSEKTFAGKSRSFIKYINDKTILLPWEGNFGDGSADIAGVDIDTGKLTLSRSSMTRQSAPLSDDDRFLATTAGLSQNYEVLIWDLSQKYAVSARLTGHKKTVYSTAFSAGAHMFMSASLDDKNLRIWELPAPAAVATGPAATPGNLVTRPAEAGLVIVKAAWKVQGRADVDVTETLASHVKDGRLEIKVSAANLV